MTTPPGRVFARYDSDDPGTVSLPGYLSANPSQVAPGDTFEYADEFSDDVLAGGRFTAVSDDEVAAASPNERLTKAQLAEKLDVTAADYTKAELVSMADDHDRANPPPPDDPDHVEADTTSDTATGTEATP